MKDIYIVMKDGQRFRDWTVTNDFNIDGWIKKMKPSFDVKGIERIEVEESPPDRYIPTIQEINEHFRTRSIVPWKR